MTMSALDAESTSHVVEIGGVPVRYHEAGTSPADVGSGPGDAGTLVFLHGGGPGASSWSNFGRNLGVFAQHYRTLMMDLPGYGKSAPRPPTANFFTLGAHALLGLIDHLGIDKVHLIGNSLGGGTALRFALNYPKRAGRLVLMGPGGLTLNVLAPDPTEGVRRLMDFGAPPGPSREKMEAFLRVKV